MWMETREAVLAKGVNSGYAPLGGVVLGEPSYRTFAEPLIPAASPTPVTPWPA
jgi:hypothetical protein